MNFLKNLFFGPPSKDQFANALMAKIRKAGDTSNLQYDKANFRLTNARDDEINLEIIYLEHCQLPLRDRSTNLKRLVKGYISANDELPESFEEARSNLRPKIWLRSSVVNLDLHLRLKGSKPFATPTFPLGEHLVIAVVYKLPAGMRSLTRDDFDKLGVTYYEAMEAAIENLANTSFPFYRIGDRFHSAMSGDSYDSSRILLKDQISSWDVLGDHVAMVPQCNAMFVTGSKDDAGLKIMLGLTESNLKDQLRPLSPIPLRLVNGEWEDWTLPRTHELFSRFQQLQIRFFGGLYAEQKELLEAIHQKEQSGPFVASCSGIHKKGSDDILTYCVWSKGVDSLLPKTQLVMMVGPNGSEAVGEWDRVVEVVGDLMEVDESLYPVRYRVREFPTEEQLKAIGMLEM